MPTPSWIACRVSCDPPTTPESGLMKDNRLSRGMGPKRISVTTCDDPQER